MEKWTQVKLTACHDPLDTRGGQAGPELFVKDRRHFRFSPEGYRMLAERVRPFLAQ